MRNHQSPNTPPADKCARRLNKRGSILISAVLAALLLTMVSVGYFATLTGSFGALKSSGDALEAQKVAEIESNKLKFTDYDSLNSKVQQGKWMDAPDNPGWQYFVTLGNEKVIDGDNKQRIAEIKVRRKGDEESRFSTVVPVSSESSGGGFNCKEGNILWNSEWSRYRKYNSGKIPKAGLLVVHLSAATEREHGSNYPAGRIWINGRSFSAGYNGGILTLPVLKGENITIYRGGITYFSCQ